MEHQLDGMGGGKKKIISGISAFPQIAARLFTLKLSLKLPICYEKLKNGKMKKSGSNFHSVDISVEERQLSDKLKH